MDADRQPGRPSDGGSDSPGDPRSGSTQDEPGPSTGSFLTRLFSLGAAPTEEDDVSDADLSAEERAMLLNVRRLGELRVIDVMVPRADIEAIDLSVELDDLVEAFRRTHHSRLPVYRDTLDDPVGFVHLKDVALRHGFGAGEGRPFELRALLRPTLYVPPSMPIDALLQKMQGGRLHMALVIDEYGGVDGLVTIEDVLEQIVGEIEDEHDVADDVAFRAEGEGVWVASARLEIPEFEDAAGVDLMDDEMDEEVDTLGGLVFMLADRVPERGEVIQHPDGHEFEVLDADPRRIKRLRVRLAEAVEAAPPSAESPAPAPRPPHRDAGRPHPGERERPVEARPARAAPRAAE
ncbi:MAG TPA: hemolysin family protein [Paracoccaceae bacterium]|nr:hemolysin family protein [Paracoccaceae bacterium]